MRTELLTPRVSLKLNHERPAFKWFIGKTNRLALYSLSLYKLELNLYVARSWEYETWQEDALLIEPTPIYKAPSAAPVPSKVLQFRALPGRGKPRPPPAQNSR